MSSPVCLITGTTHGIGTVTARALAGLGHTVVMACRDTGRGEAVRRELIAATGNDDVHVLQCDLASLVSVRRCAEDFLGRFSRLEVLINNAGTMPAREVAMAGGIGLTFATNYLGPALLTRLLLPAMTRSGGGRIVTVASNVHRYGRLDPARPGSIRPTRFSGFRAYAESKLGNVMFTLSLAERLAGSGVTANCLHPGVIATNITAGSAALRLGMRVARPFMFDPERGARTTLQLALEPGLDGVTGRYFNQHGRPAEPAPAALDRLAREALWDWTSTICGLEDVSTMAAAS